MFQKWKKSRRAIEGRALMIDRHECVRFVKILVVGQGSCFIFLAYQLNISLYISMIPIFTRKPYSHSRKRQLSEVHNSIPIKMRYRI